MVLRGTVYSRTLEMETGLTVITPNDYGQAETYRVCYVLHGLCGGSADFSNYSMLPYFAYDKDIVFICPEVHRSFYTDTAYGMKYFTYVSEELPRLTNLVFRVSASREDTAVIGCSMGGYGALKCALNRPETFGVCAAFAPGTVYMKEFLDGCRKSGQALFPDLYGVFGEELCCRETDDISALIEHFPAESEKPAIRLYCGKQDWLYATSRRLSETLKTHDFPFTYEEFEGKHDFYSFNEGVRRFVEAWKKNEKPHEG